MTASGTSALEVWVCNLGTVRYPDAISMQELVRSRRQAGEVPDTLLLVEHPPVYTLGRRADPAELSLGEERYRAAGIEVHSCDRGGRITYHGPGQLVGYPIIAIDDVVDYVRKLETALVGALARAGLTGRARPDDGPDYTGVWIGDRKIASIGVHVQRGVTTHGFAINVQNDLEPFDWVVPCGLPGVEMTSLQRELPLASAAEPAKAPGREQQVPAQLSRADDDLIAGFRGLTVEAFCEAFGRVPRQIRTGELGPPAATMVPA